MQKNIYSALLIMAIVTMRFSFAIAGKEDLPNPPQGYTWQWCEGIKAGFLKPDGWYFKEEEKGDTKAFFISKESADKEGMFKTGLSVNAVKYASVKTRKLPSEYARESINKMRLLLECKDSFPAGDGVYFKGYACICHSKSPLLVMVMQYTLALGNDNTGTFYLIVFESPETEWDQAWKIGRPIIDNLALESEY